MKVFNSDITRSELLRRGRQSRPSGKRPAAYPRGGLSREVRASWTFGLGVVSVSRFKSTGAWTRAMRSSTAPLSHGCRRNCFLHPRTGRTTITRGCATSLVGCATPPG